MEDRKAYEEACAAVDGHRFKEAARLCLQQQQRLEPRPQQRQQQQQRQQRQQQRGMHGLAALEETRSSEASTILCFKALRAVALSRDGEEQEAVALAREVDCQEERPEEADALVAVAFKEMRDRYTLPPTRMECRVLMPLEEAKTVCLLLHTLFASPRACSSSFFERLQPEAFRLYGQYKRSKYLRWTLLCMLLQQEPLSTPPRKRLALQSLTSTLLQRLPPCPPRPVVPPAAAASSTDTTKHEGSNVRSCSDAGRSSGSTTGSSTCGGGVVPVNSSSSPSSSDTSNPSSCDSSMAACCERRDAYTDLVLRLSVLRHTGRYRDALAEAAAGEGLFMLPMEAAAAKLQILTEAGEIGAAFRAALDLLQQQPTNAQYQENCARLALALSLPSSPFYAAAAEGVAAAAEDVAAADAAANAAEGTACKRAGRGEGGAAAAHAEPGQVGCCRSSWSAATLLQHFWETSDPGSFDSLSGLLQLERLRCLDALPWQLGQPWTDAALDKALTSSCREQQLFDALFAFINAHGHDPRTFSVLRRVLGSLPIRARAALEPLFEAERTAALAKLTQLLAAAGGPSSSTQSSSSSSTTASPSSYSLSSSVTAARTSEEGRNEAATAAKFHVPAAEGSTSSTWKRELTQTARKYVLLEKCLLTSGLKSDDFKNCMRRATAWIKLHYAVHQAVVSRDSSDARAAATTAFAVGDLLLLAVEQLLQADCWCCVQGGTADVAAGDALGGEKKPAGGASCANRAWGASPARSGSSRPAGTRPPTDRSSSSSAGRDDDDSSSGPLGRKTDGSGSSDGVGENNDSSSRAAATSGSSSGAAPTSGSSSGAAPTSGSSSGAAPTSGSSNSSSLPAEERSSSNLYAWQWHRRRFYFYALTLLAAETEERCSAAGGGGVAAAAAAGPSPNVCALLDAVGCALGLVDICSGQAAHVELKNVLAVSLAYPRLLALSSYGCSKAFNNLASKVEAAVHDICSASDGLIACLEEGTYSSVPGLIAAAAAARDSLWTSFVHVEHAVQGMQQKTATLSLLFAALRRLGDAPQPQQLSYPLLAAASCAATARAWGMEAAATAAAVVPYAALLGPSADGAVPHAADPFAAAAAVEAARAAALGAGVSVLDTHTCAHGFTLPALPSSQLRDTSNPVQLALSFRLACTRHRTCVDDSSGSCSGSKSPQHPQQQPLQQQLERQQQTLTAAKGNATTPGAASGSSVNELSNARDAIHLQRFRLAAVAQDVQGCEWQQVTPAYLLSSEAVTALPASVAASFHYIQQSDEVQRSAAAHLSTSAAAVDAFCRSTGRSVLLDPWPQPSQDCKQVLPALQGVCSSGSSGDCHESERGKLGKQRQQREPQKSKKSDSCGCRRCSSCALPLYACTCCANAFDKGYAQAVLFSSSSSGVRQPAAVEATGAGVTEESAGREPPADVGKTQKLTTSAAAAPPKDCFPRTCDAAASAALASDSVDTTTTPGKGRRGETEKRTDDCEAAAAATAGKDDAAGPAAGPAAGENANAARPRVSLEVVAERPHGYELLESLYGRYWKQQYEDAAAAVATAGTAPASRRSTGAAAADTGNSPWSSKLETLFTSVVHGIACRTRLRLHSLLLLQQLFTLSFSSARLTASSIKADLSLLLPPCNWTRSSCANENSRGASTSCSRRRTGSPVDSTTSGDTRSSNDSRSCNGGTGAAQDCDRGEASSSSSVSPGINFEASNRASEDSRNNSNRSTESVSGGNDGECSAGALTRTQLEACCWPSAAVAAPLARHLWGHANASSEREAAIDTARLLLHATNCVTASCDALEQLDHKRARKSGKERTRSSRAVDAKTDGRRKEQAGAAAAGKAANNSELKQGDHDEVLQLALAQIRFFVLDATAVLGKATRCLQEGLSALLPLDRTKKKKKKPKVAGAPSTASGAPAAGNCVPVLSLWDALHVLASLGASPLIMAAAAVGAVMAVVRGRQPLFHKAIAGLVGALVKALQKVQTTLKEEAQKCAQAAEILLREEGGTTGSDKKKDGDELADVDGHPPVPVPWLRCPRAASSSEAAAAPATSEGREADFCAQQDVCAREEDEETQLFHTLWNVKGFPASTYRLRRLIFSSYSKILDALQDTYAVRCRWFQEATDTDTIDLFLGL